MEISEKDVDKPHSGRWESAGQFLLSSTERNWVNRWERTYRASRATRLWGRDENGGERGGIGSWMSILEIVKKSVIIDQYKKEMKAG